MHNHRDGSVTFLATIFLCLALLASCDPPTHAAELKTQNVFLIMSDGLRWQELFGGAQKELLATVKKSESVQQQFWRESAEERRQALLPFMWTEIARRGQIFGNQPRGSIARVTNGRKFSYPGYNETLTGITDPRIDSNKKIPNTNVTVFEWLNGRPGFKGRVAALASWDVFPYILNCERSGLPLWPGWEDKFDKTAIHVPTAVEEMRRDATPLWSDLTLDTFVHHAALDYVRQQQPRVLFIGFGETDEWAHEGRYDLYLQAANHVDRFVRQLWETAQSLPQYRDNTTFILTTDHGRGSGATDWKSHGEKVDGAENIWLAVLGPDTPALGERTKCDGITQSQVAATIAALLGEDFNAFNTKAAMSIGDAIQSRAK